MKERKRAPKSRHSRIFSRFVKLADMEVMLTISINGLTKILSVPWLVAIANVLAWTLTHPMPYLLLITKTNMKTIMRTITKLLRKNDVQKWGNSVLWRFDWSLHGWKMLSRKISSKWIQSNTQKFLHTSSLWNFIKRFHEIFWSRLDFQALQIL